MEGYTAHFYPFDVINDKEPKNVNINLGCIEIKNSDSIISKFTLNLWIYNNDKCNIIPNTILNCIGYNMFYI
jgi:hypothetical protein